MDAMTLDVDGGYEVIALTGSLPVYDPRFERALAVGGRLFVISGVGGAMAAQRITRTGPAQWQRESLFETAVPALIHARQPPKFVF
jgi:protein-L-isoaspartate(D-aspartate) O-methyltransferase